MNHEYRAVELTPEQVYEPSRYDPSFQDWDGGLNYTHVRVTVDESTGATYEGVCRPEDVGSDRLHNRAGGEDE
ncbi:hypothetical protein FZ103_04240 [Streptomonospora sp. PA3]|uniref:hypothetical protein n=1 Tax=Streptomonospora sp. PA3 TaxID=2607326 RepID=UPI0012DCA22B|nr:hypothetical protein [Streptomonospora sp. PA3]MUL40395.1 hypothetical protein [Streptomonospora sp. PA3]